MNLNERERRELKDIAEWLEREDAGLAGMLRTMQPGRKTGMQGAGTLTAVIAVALLVLAIAAAAVAGSPSPGNSIDNQPRFHTSQLESPNAYVVQSHGDRLK